VIPLLGISRKLSALYFYSDSGATPDTVKKAFEILLSDKKVKAIFINIFGGEP